MAPTRRIGVSPVSDLARRRASLPTDAGHLNASCNIENLGLLVGQMLTDQASETALHCALMWRSELFDVDLSNVMPGVMPGDFERN